MDTYSGKFLIDTGSSIIVIATRAFGTLNQDIKPTDRKVRTANDGFLNIKGICSLTIQLDHLTFQQEFIIADIDESLGILGVNFLDKYGADIKIKKRILKAKEKLNYISVGSRYAPNCSYVKMSHFQLNLRHLSRPICQIAVRHTLACWSPRKKMLIGDSS